MNREMLAHLPRTKSEAALRARPEDFRPAATPPPADQIEKAASVFCSVARNINDIGFHSFTRTTPVPSVSAVPPPRAAAAVHTRRLQ